MGRIIHICVCIFASILATTAMLAQNPFTYYKGKGYEDIAAYRMKKVIDLNTYIPSAPILYEQSVPEHQNTLSYKVALPPYLCGAFFSRDSRTDDHQWPNNTSLPTPNLPRWETPCFFNSLTASICLLKPLQETIA